MARPNSSLRLRDIDPEQLAKSVTDVVMARLFRMAYVVDINARPVMWIVRGDHDPNELRRHIRQLAEYAMGRTNTIFDTDEYSLQICDMVWGNACNEPLSVAVPKIDPDKLADDWQGHLLLVLHAAPARVKLDLGQDMSPVELGILSGCSPHHIRLLCRTGFFEGCIKTDDGWRIPSESAGAWIVDRRRW